MDNLTIDDIMQDPHKFGAPTFDEYCRDRDKYQGRWDDTFSAIDQGSRLGLQNHLTRMKYEIDGIRCDSLEEVEKRAIDLGLDLSIAMTNGDLSFHPEVQDQGGQRCEIMVRFFSKAFREKIQSEIQGRQNT